MHATNGNGATLNRVAGFLEQPEGTDTPAARETTTPPAPTPALPPNLDRLRALLAQSTADTLYRVFHEGLTVERVEAVSIAGNWQVRLTVEPVEKPPPRYHFSECERDIMAILVDAKDYMVGSAIVSALDRANKIHGESTVHIALSRMVRSSLIGNNRKPPKGYYVTDLGREAFEEVRNHG